MVIRKYIKVSIRQLSRFSHEDSEDIDTKFEKK